MVQGADPGRVVAAIFKPAQALEEEWHGVLFAYVSDDPAHVY
jgi:hypothetical protein